MGKRTNDEWLNKAGLERLMLTNVKKRKLKYFQHIVRQGNTIEKLIMIGIMEREAQRRTKNILDYEHHGMDLHNNTSLSSHSTIKTGPCGDS